MDLNISKRVESIRYFFSQQLKTRPVLNVSACIGCADCKSACPTKAIELFAFVPDIELPPKAGEPRFKPEVNYDKCTRCYRCQEQCRRKAIKTYKPRMMRMLRR